MGNYELDLKIGEASDLKPDNDKRPLWVCPDGTIILETSSKFYKQASHFCIAIAEPESRLQQFHEYKITSASLYGAACAGLDSERIIEVLKLLCKSELPDGLITSIRENTSNVGKLKLYLKEGSVILEGDTASDVSTILTEPDVKSAVEAHLSAKSLRMDSTKLVQVREKCSEICYPLVEEYEYKNDTTCPSVDIKLNPKAMLLLRPSQVGVSNI